MQAVDTEEQYSLLRRYLRAATGRAWSTWTKATLADMVEQSRFKTMSSISRAVGDGRPGRLVGACLTTSRPRPVDDLQLLRADDARRADSAPTSSEQHIVRAVRAGMPCLSRLLGRDVKRMAYKAVSARSSGSGPTAGASSSRTRKASAHSLALVLPAGGNGNDSYGASDRGSDRGPSAFLSGPSHGRTAANCHPLPIDRPADMLGARRWTARHSRGNEGRQVEFEPSESSSFLTSLSHVFTSCCSHPPQPSGEHFVEVAQQPDIVAIIMADVGDE